MASLPRAAVPNPSRRLWLCLLCLGACKLGAAAPASTCAQPAPVPATQIPDAAPAPAPDASAPTDCRTPFGKLLAELSHDRLVDMALMDDSLLLLIKEDAGREARVLRVRTDRALGEPQILAGCPHGADRIAVDGNYVYLPCLGSRSANWAPNQLDPSLNYDGYVSAIALDGSESRLLVAKTRRPFWIGTDSSFVYWYDRVILYRLPKPHPGLPLDELPPDRVTQHMPSRDVFVGSDGIYSRDFMRDIARVTPSPRCVRLAETGTYADVTCLTASGHTERWRVPKLSHLLGVNARNELFVELDRQPNEVFRFVAESGALVPVARIDQPVEGILWLHDGSMLVRSADTLWRTTMAGGSPTGTTRWRHFPRAILGWAADEHTLYLALKGSSLEQTRGFGLYALPLGCGTTAER